MKGDLKTLLDFVKFTHEIREVTRTIHFEHDKRQENDMEHGYQLALVAWFLIENDKLPLDKFRCVGMALVHDTIEVYSGDVSAHLPGAYHPSRKKNEALAAAKLKKRWPNFKSLHDLVDEYEALQTPEAVFVYALDKLIPIINIYLYGGRSWHLMDISLDDLKRIKVGKVDISAEINKYYQEFLKILERQPELFGKVEK
ncbi:MAG TPA: HD domain-containing protein [Candidatus Saccharimonadales bacterium]|nr:HD domain-containing protein [Candidatus Saccharimonadales bacterium]